MGVASIEDYENNRIKKHEFTLPKKELDRTKLTNVQSANVGPTFLTFRENQDAIKERIAAIVAATQPYGDVTCDDGVRHVVWKVSVEDSAWFVEQFAGISSLYIADGHHRAAAAFNVGKMRREAAQAAGTFTGEEPFNFFMTLLYPADNLLILDYNRVIKSLNDLSPEAFLEALGDNFTVTQLEEGQSSKVPQRHSYSLFLGGKWYRMVVKEDKVDQSTPVTRLDSSIITEFVLKAILNIQDIKNDPRIDFVGGIRGHAELERRCQVDCVAAIAMFPCPIQELLEVADAGLIMPPKSTWFEPKPRSGFVVRLFD